MRESMTRDFITFITRNPLYLLCSIAYYVFASLSFGGKPIHYVLALVLYLLSLFVAFSPLGETILRLIEKVRRIETNREKELLYPLLEEVYTEARKRFPNLGYIELCIIDKITVNACAMGKHTIAITKGAIETFSADELKGVMAHEIAHIVYLDTVARLYAVIGNGIYTILFLILKAIMYVTEQIHNVEGESRAMGLAIRLVRLLIEFIIFLTMILMQAVLALDSRKSEFQADRFAYELGYGEELISALYLLETINLGDDSDIIQKMIAEHPRITARIERLEILEEYAQQPVQPRYRQPYYPPFMPYSRVPRAVPPPYSRTDYHPPYTPPPTFSQTHYQPPYTPPLPYGQTHYQPPYGPTPPHQKPEYQPPLSDEVLSHDKLPEDEPF